MDVGEMRVGSDDAGASSGSFLRQLWPFIVGMGGILAATGLMFGATRSLVLKEDLKESVAYLERGIDLVGKRVGDHARSDEEYRKSLSENGTFRLRLFEAEFERRVTRIIDERTSERFTAPEGDELRREIVDLKRRIGELERQ
jgi:uncharacterized membrane-anchored protein YjiN (DUF445 family)